MTDAQSALAQVREALAARPTPGQWFAVNDGNRTEPFMNVKAERISGRGPTHEVAICATGDSPQSMETANARYIAACSPVNIAAILAHVDAQAAENEQLREMLARLYAGSDLYCDDGELQDARATPYIDFKRDSVADIRRAIVERNERKEQR